MNWITSGLNSPIQKPRANSGATRTARVFATGTCEQCVKIQNSWWESINYVFMLITVHSVTRKICPHLRKFLDEMINLMKVLALYRTLWSLASDDPWNRKPPLINSIVKHESFCECYQADVRYFDFCRNKSVRFVITEISDTCNLLAIFLFKKMNK